MSVPTWIAPYAATAAAPAPADEPPVVSAGSHGERVMPCSDETPDESIPQSGIVVDPTMTAPASRNRSTTGESRTGTTGVAPAQPPCIATPARARFSLTVTGMPSSGPSGSPCRQRSSDCAAASADSRSRAAVVAASWRTRALIVGSKAAIRARTADRTSTGDNARDPKAADSVATSHIAGSVIAFLPSPRPQWQVYHRRCPGTQNRMRPPA